MHFSQFQDTTDALPCHIHLPVCLWIMDPHSRFSKKNTSHENEVLPQVTRHLLQRPCYQWGSKYQDPAGNQTTRGPPDHRKETPTAVVWTCLPFIRSGQNNLARHSEREEEDNYDRRRGGKTTPGNGQAWSSASPRGQCRTEKNGGKWLWNYLWCPNDPIDEGIDEVRWESPPVGHIEKVRTGDIRNHWKNVLFGTPEILYSVRSQPCTVRRSFTESVSSLSCPRGLTVTWWGCYGLCFWHKPTELAYSFLFCYCVYICLCGPFNCMSFHEFPRQLSVLFFRSYLCLIDPFNYMSLYERLLQPWYLPYWLNGLKTPIY